MSKKADKKDMESNKETAPLPFPSPLQRAKSKIRNEVTRNWDQVRVKIKKDLRAATVNPFFIHGMGKILAEEDLQKLRAGLDPEEISSLNKYLETCDTSPLDEGSLTQMSLELKKVSIDGPGALSPESSVILEGLSPTQIMEFLEAKPEHTAAVFENLSPYKIGRLLDDLDETKTDSFFSKAKEGSNADIAAFEKDLESFKTPKRSPFRSSLSLAIKRLSPSKEKALYQGMLARGEKETANELAREAFPSFLIIDLPKDVLEQPLKKISATEHASFLFCQEQADKERWLEIIAPDGSKLRQMLQMEIETIEESPEKNKKISSQREEINRSYFGKIKQEIDSRKYTQTKAETVNQWLDKSA